MDLKSRIVVFIGPEGSGKTTMAKKLAEQTGLPRITTGDIIRDLAKNDDGPLGEECRTILKANTYLSPESFLKIMSERFRQKDVSEGMILDGSMRTLRETQDFHLVLREASLRLPLSVVYLHIPLLTSFSRLVFSKNARKRDDDTLLGVAGRLSVFHFQLNKRVEAIRNQQGWSLQKVDATQPMEQVFEEILHVLSF
ncbi:TPA: hypothetical protein DIU27_03725 [Candidatus Collierbacteria bacterium]|uniref:Adenylate kinase n=1 Tax=Candidatus Collierbacteria bacterium GW2011_GWB2_44_22 TaxID=1618387 RepID=A0A0G1HZA5_9BACT|nr:MAG: Adenylate kinase [Candidatus Collierbacteria bacterium GW2011_GWA2_44_13]KKT50465.1 MAG: Adenylate kinase [Candidatus Collierbacteria bacterium GW2011_GWB1_44_197]KKT52300.1 MAG: Adenylate kinase [Candidatus Collierbacteria bacterium GW2011_GWB2_44_22]KKT63220.1 MAG: Adenylate kinase [Candidatus Collierbacteria bacterium GW2011_GWD1_44_27]KKT66130.1 MAG: Adenylate kinase [Candidatus Collierbacteria bacterium GW2011_GWC2_44_30]KKT89003.1 MAG: Adenylate kinase [Candidatus Collierbacteria